MCSPLEKKIPLKEIIAKNDELFNAGSSFEIGEHLRFWLSKAQEFGDKQGELSLWNELMGHYRMTNDRPRGMEAVRRGMELIEELGIAETFSAGTIFLNGATALQSFGETDAALELYEKCRTVYNAQLPLNDRCFAGLYNNMAAALAAKGAFKEAENAYLQALDLLKEGGAIPDSAVTCLNLAQLYRQWNGDEAMIETMVACAVEYFNAPECPRDGYYAHSCTKCASGFEALGYGEIARELLSRAGEYYERT